MARGKLAVLAFPSALLVSWEEAAEIALHEHEARVRMRLRLASLPCALAHHFLS